MGISGIVAEFNPLHNGHKYLIDRAKKDSNTVICVVSGNFVQRGDVAIVPKFVRADMALSCGADVVVELPTPWAMSTAQNFAFGAVSQLLAFGIDSLYFGSESGNLNEIEEVANILLSQEFSSRLSKSNSKGATFASLRSEIVDNMLGYNSAVLKSPNDTLATEYICAAKRLGANIKFVPVKRIGTGHNDSSENGSFSNATLLRNEIIKQNFETLNNYMPKECLNLLLGSPIADIKRLDTAIISRLKLLKKEDLVSIPDISEGLENLLYSKIRVSNSYTELLSLLKTKRYTLARLRRIVLSTFLGIDSKFLNTEPPYVRVLGFKDNLIGQFTDSSKPIVTKVSQIKELDALSKEVFELENSVNEIYALSLDNPKKFTNENSEKLIIK